MMSAKCCTISAAADHIDIISPGGAASGKVQVFREDIDGLMAALKAVKNLHQECEVVF